jgi:hypothetical protein
MVRSIRLIFALGALSLAVPAHADPALDSFARDVERTEGVRAVTTLQRSYAQYAQFGLWDQVGALFAADGTFVFDGQVTPGQTATGPAAIAAFLRNRYGGGSEGLQPDGLSTMMIENPVVNLSPDGTSAKARWDVMIFHGHDGKARIEGGVFENEYALDRGVWKIQVAHYYPQYDGPYEKGWTNWGGGDLPIAPHHFDVRTAGIPIPPSVGAAPATDKTLGQLQAAVDNLNDRDRVRSLQAAYGFYQDRKMWDDVVDLFADDGAVEVGGQGIWRGKDGVRRWLSTMGPAGLNHGQLNDQVQFDVTVTVAPGGREAWARGVELGMLGEADQEKGWWQVSAFQNRFVKEDGAWKLRELRRFPLMKSDIFQGWGKSRIVDPVPTGSGAPDAAVPADDAAAPGLAMPAFVAAHPVTGQAGAPAGRAKLVATTALTHAIVPGPVEPIDLSEAQRRLARSAAFDGIQNVSAAYGYFLDDGMPRGFSGVLADKGYKMTPFAGYYIGRERVIKARVQGEPPKTRPGIPYHWLMQPVIQVSDDGRSAKGRFRLFQPRTAKAVGKAGDFLGAALWGGMYHNRYVLEDGVWRVWELTLDEPYITPVAWTDGIWAKAKDPDPNEPKRTFKGGNFPPDVPLTALGEREEHFAGGPGETLRWPSILPMWFSYTNPVSGRVPEHYQPQCVPCAIRPDLRLDANGYQEPPDAPEANRAH